MAHRVGGTVRRSAAAAPAGRGDALGHPNPRPSPEPVHGPPDDSARAVLRDAIRAPPAGPGGGRPRLRPPGGGRARRRLGPRAGRSPPAEVSAAPAPLRVPHTPAAEAPGSGGPPATRHRRRARRAGLGAGPRDRPALGVRPAGPRAGGGRDHLPADLRRGRPLRRLPRPRSAAGAHPRPAERPGRRVRRRLGRLLPRHLPRPAAGVRVPDQPARGPDGPDPQRGRQRRRGGRLLGRHLALGGPGHRGRLRGRGGDPVHLAPLPGRRRSADLGVPGVSRAAAERRAQVRVGRSRQGRRLRPLPGPGDPGVRRGRAGQEPGARPDRDHRPDRAAPALPRRRLRRRRHRPRARAHRALGRDPEPDALGHRQPGLLPGRGGRGPARRQHPLHPLLSGEAAVLPRRGGLLLDADRHGLHPQRLGAGLGRQADRQAGPQRGRRVRRRGLGDQPGDPGQPELPDRLPRPLLDRRGGALPARRRGVVDRRRAGDQPGGDGLLQPRLWRRRPGAPVGRGLA